MEGQRSKKKESQTEGVTNINKKTPPSPLGLSSRVGKRISRDNLENTNILVQTLNFMSYVPGRVRPSRGDKCVEGGKREYV